MRRIVCIGNRYEQADDAGPRVFDRLRRGRLAPGIALVDGGLAGLNLLPCFDGAGRVVFVDAVRGFGEPDSVHVIEGSRVAAWAEPGYHHGSGLPYLLRMAAVAAEGRMPDTVLVGVEAPASDTGIEAAAAVAVRAAALDNPPTSPEGMMR